MVLSWFKLALNDYEQISSTFTSTDLEHILDQISTANQQIISNKLVHQHRK
jgi:hypothetical protein